MGSNPDSSGGVHWWNSFPECFRFLSKLVSGLDRKLSFEGRGKLQNGL